MKILITLIIISLIVVGCANVQSPPGGSGDTTAPNIEYTYPMNKTKNFSDDYISIGFDGYMNRAKVIENLRVSPDVKISYDWNAKELTATFEGPLLENTTYSVILGTDYTDYYNNSPKQAFSMIFSTGNKLDSGTISGRLSAQNTKGKYVFLYRQKNGEFPDIETATPDYFVGTGSTGEFQFVALKSGTYRLLAIDDKFQNHKYDDQIDDFGTALSDITLTDDSLSVAGIKLYLGPKTDKTGPKIVGANSIYAGLVNVTFDENLDIKTIKKENFTLTDRGADIPIIGLGINQTTSSEIMLIYDKALMGQKLKLLATNLTDSTGNTIQENGNSIEFTVDSTYNNDDFTIAKTNLNDSTKKDLSPNFNIVNERKSFNVQFNKIPEISSLETLAYLKSGKDSIPLRLISDDLLNYYFVSDSAIKENTDYTLVFDTENIKDMWDNSISKDTVYRTKFKTGFAPKYSKLGGTIEVATACDGDIIIVANNTKDKTKYTTTAVNGVWNFDQVTAGTYVFEVFCDENKDGKYNFGNVSPFAFREKYSKSRDYKVQENWEYKDIKLKLNE